MMFRTDSCSNCGRTFDAKDLSDSGICLDCAQFARETNIFGGMR